MQNADQAGKVYHFDNPFLKSPRQYGSVRLLQMGELCGRAGYGISLHQQVCCEISCVLAGEAVFAAGELRCSVREGDVFLNCTGETHAIYAEPDSSLRFLYLGFLIDRNGPEMAELADFFEHPGELRCRQDHSGISGCMSRLLEEFYRKDRFSEIMIEKMLTEILVITFRNFNRLPVSLPPVQNHSDAVGNVVYQVIRYVESHAAQITGVQEIAAALGYSPAYLSHTFRRQTGTTLRQYLAEKKIDCAEELLCSGRYSITQTAMHLGYDTPQSFSKAFRRVRGMSPGACRKLWEKEHEHE